MNNFTRALAAIHRLKTEGVVADYAIGGAMALVFWSEPIPTFDLDVFVLLSSKSTLVSLEPIYEWARRNHFRQGDEHIMIAGLPVQVIPALQRACRGSDRLSSRTRLRGPASSRYSSRVPDRALPRAERPNTQASRARSRLAGRKQRGSRVADYCSGAVQLELAYL